MKILLALLFPPLGILLCGRIILAIIFFVLWVLFAALCALGVGFALLPLLSVAAIYIVINHDANKRTEKLVKAMNQPQRR